ncbi:hypothetical protein OHA72_16420 [Dactylosporangium sp. NBC_01737]|uniref:hypothetical protein n=1 Tax=Dactylosporangium sp. NBC_01737 TaxID=2975959 RepID=UPI002E119010|nr:hypothetical protein OHA72_16420 [Dactylosporangium sp. NBC_01737]
MTAPLDALKGAGAARSSDTPSATGPSDAFTAALAAATHGRASLGAPTQGARDHAPDRRPDRSRDQDREPEQRFPVRDRRARDERPRTPDPNPVASGVAVHQQHDAVVRRPEPDRRDRPAVRPGTWHARPPWIAGPANDRTRHPDDRPPRRGPPSAAPSKRCSPPRRHGRRSPR